METSQEGKQKNVMVVSILVPVFIVLLFLGLQTYFLQQEMADVKEQLAEVKGLLLHVENEAVSEGQEELPETTATVEQAVSSALITDVPKANGIEEEKVSHKVYLTFDDGPSKQTDAILDILDEYNVKATFFVVGKDGEEVKERLKKIYQRGHTIGMHSYSHDYTKIYESVDAFREDFLQSKQFIYDAIGVESDIYRFPGGSSNTLSKISMQEFADYLHEQGVEYYDWNVSSGDGGGKLMPANIILDNCIGSISRYETSIILMHDSANKSTTVEALPQIIEKIQAMEDTAILPITMNSKPIHHAIKEIQPEPVIEPKNDESAGEKAEERLETESADEEREAESREQEMNPEQNKQE